MALPNTGITTNLIKSTIGKNSNNLGELVASSIAGGTGGYAFSITENGGTTGELINNAKPFFNIFSTNSPSMWYKSGSAIKCKLKNSSVSTLKNYSFSLGDFRGYDHQAQPLEFTASGAWHQAENLIYFTGMLTSGSFDWSTVMSEQYGIIPSLSVYDASGLIKQLTLYAGEAYSTGVTEYYFSGQMSETQALNHIFKVGFTVLKSDGTPGAVTYELQENGWATTKITGNTQTVYPSDVPTTATFGIDIPYYVTITDDTTNVSIDPNNAQYTRFSVSFKCLDYTNVPIGERTRTISVTVINPVTHETLYDNQNFGTYTLKSSNTISITIPIYYTEMNKVYGVGLV